MKHTNNSCGEDYYRNDLFTSNDPMKVVEFYSGFDNREQLIHWMKNRPKSVGHIHEIEGDRDTIMVITTADFQGKFARECREIIFKGLHVVFVESGGRADPYFNAAHNLNAGIEKALEYNPKWIVFSSDDVFKIDDVSVLVSELSKLDFKDIGCVFTKPSKYHSLPARITNAKFTRNFTLFLLDLARGKSKWSKFERALEEKFQIKWFLSICTNPAIFNFLTYKKKGFDFISFTDFGIFSSDYLTKCSYLFDETFINGYEDIDFALRIKRDRIKTQIIDYKLGDYVGSTLGTGKARALRNISGLAYLNYKLENGFLEATPHAVMESE